MLLAYALMRFDKIAEKIPHLQQNMFSPVSNDTVICKTWSPHFLAKKMLSYDTRNVFTKTLQHMILKRLGCSAIVFGKMCHLCAEIVAAATQRTRFNDIVTAKSFNAERAQI